MVEHERIVKPNRSLVTSDLHAVLGNDETAQTHTTPMQHELRPWCGRQGWKTRMTAGRA